MVPTTNRASDLLDGVDDIKRRRTKFREIAILGILESISNEFVDDGRRPWRLRYFKRT